MYRSIVLALLLVLLVCVPVAEASGSGRPTTPDLYYEDPNVRVPLIRVPTTPRTTPVPPPTITIHVTLAPQESFLVPLTRRASLTIATVGQAHISVGKWHIVFTDSTRITALPGVSIVNQGVEPIDLVVTIVPATRSSVVVRTIGK